MRPVPFEPLEPQWCPGCGNFDILNCVKEALLNLKLTTRDCILVAGIGQASKLGFSIKCNLFNGLHGRALPAALGVNLANHKVKLLSVSGDGDFYAEGGNHFIHAAKRNLNIAVLAGDNRVYGLTQGQASPTAVTGYRDALHPEGTAGKPLNPILLALASGATFVARAFSGNQKELTGLIEQALGHRGFALVDILYPCVTFNKVNNFGYFKQRVRPIGSEHNPAEYEQALKLAAQENEEKLLTGVFYKVLRPVYSDAFSTLKDATIAERTGAFKPDRVHPFLDQYK